MISFTFSLVGHFSFPFETELSIESKCIRFITLCLSFHHYHGYLLTEDILEPKGIAWFLKGVKPKENSVILIPKSVQSHFGLEELGPEQLATRILKLILDFISLADKFRLWVFFSQTKMSNWKVYNQIFIAHFEAVEFYQRVCISNGRASCPPE